MRIPESENILIVDCFAFSISICKLCFMVISVNTNQEIYLVPAQLLKSGSKNPSKKQTAGNGIKCETKISESTFFGFDLLSCLLYTSPRPRDKRQSRMPSSA